MEIALRKKPRQSNVLQLCHGKHNTRLKLASLDDASAGIKYGVASPILCGAWIVADGRSMPVTTKVSISVNFKTIVTFGTHRDYLSPCSLEILNQVDYRVFMWHSWILREAGALMCCIGNVGYGALLQEVDLFHNLNLEELRQYDRESWWTDLDSVRLRCYWGSGRHW